MPEVAIPSTQEWRPGETYRLSFTVDAPKFLSIETVQTTVDSIVRKIAEDPRLRVETYSFSPATDELTVTVHALQSGSPIFVIVGAILGIAALYSFTLVLREIRQLVHGPDRAPGEKPNRLADTFRALGGAGVLLALGSVALLFGLRRVGRS